MLRPNKNGADDLSSAAETEVVPLLQEEVHIGKREVSAGKVRIRTATETFEEIARETLQGETVEVTRVPVDRIVDEAPETRTEGGVTIVPVLEEVLFVEKRLVLKEELHIRRQATTETVEVPVTLRRQRAIVERVPGSDTFNDSEENI